MPEQRPTRLVLAVEASSGTYAVAVGSEGQPRATRVSRRDAPAFAGLGDLVARTMAAAGAAFPDVTAIAVDVGPGSLSAVRAAVAYANGLAFGLGVMVVPVGSLELLAIEARAACRGPLLCLRKGEGGNAYAALFGAAGDAGDGGVTMRYGPRAQIVPAMVGDIDRLCVAGAYRDEAARLLPGVMVEDSGVESPSVDTLYQVAAVGGPGRLVPAASPLNEASPAFHESAPSRHPQRG